MFPFRNKAKGLHQNYCKDCKKLYNKTWYSNDTNRANQIRRASDNRKVYVEKLIDWKISYVEEQGGCSYSGCDVKDPIMIDFDHIDPTNKSMDVSTMISRGYGLDKIKDEATKCQLLCANHHRLKTAEQIGWRMCLVSVSPPSPKGLKA